MELEHAREQVDVAKREVAAAVTALKQVRAAGGPLGVNATPGAGVLQETPAAPAARFLLRQEVRGHHNMTLCKVANALLHLARTAVAGGAQQGLQGG